MSREEFEECVESLFENPGNARVRAHIEAMAAADAELRARWEDLQPAVQALAGARLEPLPAGLHEALIEKIEMAQVARAAHVSPRPRVRARGDWRSIVLAAIQVRPAFALGGAVAAGIAIGAVGLGLLIGPSQDLREGRDLAASTSASLPPVTDASAITVLDLDDAHVTLTTTRYGETADLADVIVRLDMRGEAAAVVKLAWDPAAFRWSGVRWETPEAPAFETGPGSLSLPFSSAAGSELIFSRLAPSGSTVRATLSAAGHEKEEAVRMPR